MNQNKNRWMIAVVLAFAVIISITFLVFAFVTRSNAERAAIEYEVKMHALEAQLNSCVREAAQAREEAARAQAIAEEAARQKR